MTFEEMLDARRDLIHGVTTMLPREYVATTTIIIKAWWDKHIQQLAVQHSFNKLELDHLKGDKEGYIDYGKQRMFRSLGQCLNRPEVCEAKFLPDEYHDAEGRMITRRPDADYAATLEARVFVLATKPIQRANVGPMQGQ